MKLVKYAISIVLCNLYRLLRFIPNNDPIMGFMLPYAKQDKWWNAALFSFVTMVSFDVITNAIGIWTVVTAGTYAVLGMAFHFAYKGRNIGLKEYFASGIAGVLIFDFITGPVMSSLMWNMSFAEAFAGQIPFTINHLLTVGAFVLVLTPLLDRHLVNSVNFEDSKILGLAGIKA